MHFKYLDHGCYQFLFFWNSIHIFFLFSFIFFLFLESSIPNIIVINSTTLTELSFIEARFGETVPLACQLSYENSGPTDKTHFKLSVSWKKDGNNRSIAEEPIQYKAGNNVFTYNHSVTIGKSSDGGTYWCQSHFIFYQISYERNASVELKSKFL